MATAGLSFADPFLGKVSVGEEPNPYAPYTPMTGIGAGGLAPSAADMAVMGEALAKQSQFTLPKMQRPPAIAFSPSSKELFVNGLTFSADDAATALQSEAYLRGPGTQMPTGGDWVPLDEQAYSQYLNSIRNPSLGRLASKNFGRGVDQMQMLAGRGLQLAGAEGLGGRIVEAQEEDLRKTSPFERQFTDIESGRGAVEWLVANFAQQGPNLIESVATAGLGALAGTAMGGPAAGAAAAMAGLLGKQAWKESVIAALAKKAAGAELSKLENKLLREAAGLTGAVAASYTQNLATGAADIYGELRDQGANADDIDARLKALAGSVPYALLETLPEFLLAGRLLGGFGAPRPIPAGSSITKRGAELLRRGAIGGTVGGLSEGTTETGQEALLLGISGQDLSSPEGVNRLINSFAAGFGVGGPIGAGAHMLRGREPANLLDPAKPSDPTPGRDVIPQSPTLSPSAPKGTQGELFPTTAVGPQGAMLAPGTPRGAQGEMFPGASMQQPVAATPPGTVPGISGAQGELFAPMQPDMFDQLATQDRIRASIVPSVPATIPGQQGVLNLFADTGISTQELAARMQPQIPTPGVPAPSAPSVPSAPAVDTRQGALQFAGPAPTAPANSQMANQLQVIQDRIRRQREFEAAQAQQQARIQQEIEQLARQSRGARDVYALQQEQQQTSPQSALPMRPSGPTQPVQLPLFTRRQAPRPSRAEGLRRGQKLPAMTGEVPQTAAQRRAQLSLFTQEGQPSVAALKAAGGKTKVAPAPPKAPVVKARTQRGLKKQAGVAAVEIKETPNAAKEGKLKQGRVEQRPQDNEGVRAGGNAGQQPKTQVPAGGNEAGGRGGSLKREAQSEEISPAVAAALKKGQLVQAGRQWGQYADPDAQPKWSELSDVQKEAWRKVVIEDNRPTIAATEEIAPPKKAGAALAAPSVVAEGPIPLTLERSDGAKVLIKDGKKYQEKLDADIKKYEELLACLQAAR